MKYMKKYILLFILIFLPFIVNAETCNTNDITISSITIGDKTGNVKEISEATAVGKNINLDLSMSEVGDSVEYKVLVSNESNNDYELDKNSFSIDSNYINYNIYSEDNSNIVKANSEKLIFLKVEYKNEVPNEVFESGTYNDNKSLVLNLSTGDEIVNPKTGVKNNIYILIILLGISFVSFIALNKKHFSIFLIIVIGAIIIIPISVSALCKCEINLESNVHIVKIQQFKIKIVNCSKWLDDYYEFEYGMTIKDWVNSKYIDSIVDDYMTRFGDEKETARSIVKNELLSYFIDKMGYDENYVIQPDDYLVYDSEDC